MKLNQKTWAVMAVATFASGMAAAETGYSFYGRANLSVESQTSGGTTKSVMVDNASRFGFRANRDLSGGMSVGTVLEAGTNLTNGATNGSFNYDKSTAANSTVTNKFFAREASVALNGGFGQVKLGRMPASVAYFATADYVSNHNHDTGTSSDALYDFLATGKLSNAIGYASPKMGDLKLEAQYGLKNGSGTGTSDTNNVSPVALAANYGAGPLQLGLGYESAQNPTTTAAVSASQVTARAFYGMGALGFGGYVQKSSGTNFDRTAYRLSAMYTMGQNEFHVNFGSAGNRADLANTSAKQYTLGYNYNLDKQTKVYAFVTKVDQGNSASSTTATGYGDLRSIGGGIRYNF